MHIRKHIHTNTHAHTCTHTQTHTHTYTHIYVHTQTHSLCERGCLNIYDLLLLILIFVGHQTYEYTVNVVFCRYKKLQGIMVPHVSYLAIYVLGI